MSDSMEPQVAIVSAESAKNEAMGAFDYSRSKEKLFEKNRLLIGVLGSIVGVIALALRGVPKEDHLEDGIEFSIPGMTQNSNELFPPEQYDRTEDVKKRRDHHEINQNRDHLKHIQLSGPKLIARPGSGKVLAGTLVKATLSSGASNGLVKATLNETLVSDGEVLARSGAVILGQGSSTEDRLYIHFNKLITHDGQPIPITAQAADSSDKSLGLKGSKLGGKALSLAAGIGLNFLTGASEGFQDSHGEQGVVVKRASLKNAFLQGTARASLDQSHELLSEAKNSKTSISVGQGQEFYLIFSDDGG